MMRSGRHRPTVSPVLGLFLVFCGILVANGQSLASDAKALLALRAAVAPPSLRWDGLTSPCTWLGVVCVSGRVTELHLPSHGLIGQIPPGSVGNLTGLRTLSLRFNALSGTLPTDFANLAELRYLYLQGNRLTGPIPASLLSLTNLVNVSLFDNAFSGPISAAFNSLPHLGSLLLQDNNLSGVIPELKLDLVQFNVSDNLLLTGPVPAKLAGMPADSFLNTKLCGGPLLACAEGAAPAPAPGAYGPSGMESGKDQRKLSGGAIAGIAIGSAFGLLIVIALLFLLLLLCRAPGDSDREKSAGAGGAGAKASELEVAALREKRRSSAAGSENGHRHPLPEASAAAAEAPPSAAAARVSGGSGKKLVFLDNEERVYDLEDLLRASAEVLGKGTCGTTYKAMLEMGEVVAVKRLKDMNLHEKEFREKVAAIGAVKHPNLVPLEAYYYSKDEKLLVYEHMPMGSLSSLLHGELLALLLLIR